MAQPCVWITCRWCRTRKCVKYEKRRQKYCTIRCGVHAQALKFSDAEWSARMRERGKKSGRVRRAIALRRAMKALGGYPTLGELKAFQIGWLCCRTTLSQRKRA